MDRSFSLSKDGNTLKTMEMIEATTVSLFKHRQGRLLVTTFDNYGHIYLEHTTRAVDYSDWTNYLSLLTMIVLPIFLSFIVIVVPLGGVDSNSKLSNEAYVVFQLVYNLIAYPSLAYQMILPYKDLLPDYYTWFILPVFIAGGGIVLFYYLVAVLYVDQTQEITNVIYLFGVLYNFFTIWLSYFVVCCYKWYIGDKRTVQVETESPSSIKFSDLSDLGKESSQSGFRETGEGSLFTITTRTVPLCSHLEMYPRILLLNMLFAGMFSWDSWFTTWFMTVQEQVESGAHKDNPYLPFIMACIFLVVTSTATLLVRTVGSFCDRAQPHTASSLNITGGIMGDTFLIVFLRNLFSVVDTWENFIIFTLSTSMFEVITYQFCVTETYEKVHDYFLNIALQDRGRAEDMKMMGDQAKNITLSPYSLYDQAFHFFCWAYASAHGWQDGNIFVHKNCLTLGYRYMLRISCTISFILYEVFLRYGYNQNYYAAKNPSEKQFGNLMAFIIISFVIETLVVVPASYLIWRRSRMSVFYRLLSFFNHPESRDYVIFFIWVLTHIQSDVFIAKINYQNSNL